MPWTQTDIDNLKQAIADGRGARSITFSDQSVTFNSIREMLELLAAMEGDVNTSAGTPKNIRYAVVSKGV